MGMPMGSPIGLREYVRRVRPFALAGAIGVGCAALPPNPHPLFIFLAIGLLALLGVLAALTAQVRPLASTPALIPPLGFLVVLALLLEANGEGGWGFLALIVLPVVWIALYGTGVQLRVLIVAIAALFAFAIGSGIGSPSASRYGFSVLWVLVAWLLGFTVQRLVERGRTQSAQIASQHDFLEALFAQTASMVAVLDLDGRLARVNPACELLSGFAADELIGRPFWDVLMTEQHAAAVASYWAATDPADLVGVVELPMHTRDGARHTIHWTTSALRGNADEVTKFVVHGLDVTEERTAQRALTASEYRFRTLVSHLPDTIISLYDRDLRCVAIDGPMLARQGRSPAEFEGRLLAEVTAAEGLADLEAAMRSALAGATESVEYVSPATATIYEIEVLPYLDPSGEIEGAFLVSRDVTRRREAEAEARAAEERFADSFEHAPVGMEMIDLDGRFISVNDTLAELIGHRREELLGLHTSAITHADDAGRDEHLRASIRKGEMDRYRVEKRMIHADGHPIDVAVHLSMVRTAAGEPHYFVGQVIDISDAKEFERDLRRMADHDFLTGLLNRRRFEEEIERHLRRGARYGYEGALLMLDIDRFKSVNDSLGHAAGDAAISGFARLLGANLRETDIAARLGGDEFAVLLPAADEIQAEAVAAKLVDAVRSWDFGDAFAKLAVRTSIGVIPLGGGFSAPADALLAADQAMYAAKRRGGDGFVSAGPSRPNPGSRISVTSGG
jgi:diguanylate cyclase (GGDEF)-like protein/PAS domain S-box-containing protein